MKAVIKFIKTVILVVVVLVLAAGIIFYIFGERAIKVGIETAGTKALSVGVAVDDLDISVFGGKVEIKGLTVRNPIGYQHKNLLEMGLGSVQTSIGSLMGDPIKIQSIKLDAINLTIEQKGISNNLRDVIKSIPKAEEAPPEETKAEGKDLQIDDLEITNVKVKVKLLPVPGKADTIELNLDPIRMSDLGSDEKLDMAKLAGKIMVAITKGVARQGPGVLPDDIVDSLKVSLDSVVDMGKATVKEGEKILETGKDAGKDIVEGFKGLIKTKKEE